MARETELVSVILPSHNSATWIESSVNSVLVQTHRNLELIVVDDGSKDETKELLKAITESDKRLRIVERQTCSGGPATPRNDGIQSANGEYLAFIDSDDLWHPQKLELQLAAMRKDSLNFLSSLHTPFESSPPKIEAVIEPLRTIRKSHQELIRKNWVITSSALIETSLVGDVRFSQKREYVGIEDYLTWLHLHQNSSIKSGVLVSPLVFYRLRKDSISASKTMMAKKIFYLLSNYSYREKPLGVAKYYYFATYALSALKTRLLR